MTTQNRTIAVAESCTGGLLAAALTDTPGSSIYIGFGVVSYSNEAKMKLLGVREETLRQYGAVSRQVVQEMAQGVRKLAASDLAIAVSGIAGPGGAEKGKPVGLVYLGFDSEAYSGWKKLNLKGDREAIRSKTVQMSLDYILEQVKRND